MSKKSSAVDLADRYIRGTSKEAIVQNVQALVCGLSAAAIKGLGCAENSKAYIKTRVIKHCYDKRTAEEFDFLIHNIHIIVRLPDQIYKNKDPKRGDFVFVKSLKNSRYLCSLQEVMVEGDGKQFEVATFFRVTKESYLQSYDLLWEWKGGTPSS